MELYKTTTKHSNKKVAVIEGLNGSGHAVYILRWETSNHHDWFETLAELEHYIKWG
jgi:hypothetical protein